MFNPEFDLIYIGSKHTTRAATIYRQPYSQIIFCRNHRLLLNPDFWFANQFWKVSCFMILFLFLQGLKALSIATTATCASKTTITIAAGHRRYCRDRQSSSYLSSLDSFPAVMPQCIGKKNVVWFHTFLALLFILMVYDGVETILVLATGSTSG